MKRVLIIGVGSIGHRHLRCFLDTGRITADICETNDALRDTIASQYPLNSAYSDLESALTDPPDMAVICTPAHLHIPMAIQLAKLGIDLLIEKPLSTTTDHVDQLQEIVSRKELVCGVAYVMRQHPMMQDLRDLIVSERFGRPLQLTVTSGQHFPFYRPAYRDIYYTDHATGGGAIQDAITHMVNACQWLLGPTTALVCDAAHLALEGVTVEDTVHVLTRHGSTMGSLTLNQFQNPNESTLLLNFEQATVRATFHDNHWRFCDAPEAPWQPGGQYQLERDDLFVRQANSFLDSVENRTGPACTLEEGLHTLNTNLAMLESTKSKQWFHIP